MIGDSHAVLLGIDNHLVCERPDGSVCDFDVCWRNEAQIPVISERFEEAARMSFDRPLVPLILVPCDTGALKAF